MAEHLVDRDLNRLDPTFRERVDELLRRLKAKGHDPMVWEAHRSFARAEYLAERGRGVRKSMHCYNIAVDVIDRFHRWNARPAFWKALEETCDELGLVWGGRFTRVDKPHVQAVPHTDQDYVRAATPEQIAILVAERLDISDPAVRDTVRESVRAKAAKTPVVSPQAAVDVPVKGDKR